MTASPQTAAPDRAHPAPYPVSVLELGGRVEGTPAEQAVQDMAETARTAEAHGYHRIWVAEHHSSANTASSFPAVLIAHLAARTTRIRVGAGGVMLPNHPPYSVAEQFATLQALHPGRVDLGLGRSSNLTPTTHRLLEAALRRDPGAAAAFPALIDELLGFLHHRGPERHRFHALPLAPHTATPPAVHVLGASAGSAQIAAERGLGFAYGYHLGRSKCRPEATTHYRAAFTPDPDQPGHPDNSAPHLIVSVNVVCAETDDEAEDIALRTAVYRIVHSEDTAVRGSSLSPVRQAYLARKALEELQVVRGGPATVAAALDGIVDRFGADEIMLVPYEMANADRCRTLRLAASAQPVPAGVNGPALPGCPRT